MKALVPQAAFAYIAQTVIPLVRPTLHKDLEALCLTDWQLELILIHFLALDELVENNCLISLLWTLFLGGGLSQMLTFLYQSFYLCKLMKSFNVKWNFQTSSLDIPACMAVRSASCSQRSQDCGHLSNPSICRAPETARHETQLKDLCCSSSL